MPHNLERHPTRKGTYISYDAKGFAFRVTRALSGGWRAQPSHAAADTDYRLFFAGTLHGIASQLAASAA
ncbi:MULTISPECIES: hypothetical protein [unclassified Blastomonas]|jgi:hypothetical protein|uniref:hypothetical protein n=1 Tax=unclassified Blastomonas TaxID=2626550 RepID=UPI000826CC66|nr:MULTISPECIES: hypothetical protein [unclassified Blastomonas]